jgi:hypothetical protein
MAVAVRLKHIALKARASPLSRPERDPQRGNLDVGREATPVAQRKTLTSSWLLTVAPEATQTGNPAVSHNLTGILDTAGGLGEGLACRLASGRAKRAARGCWTELEYASMPDISY